MVYSELVLDGSKTTSRAVVNDISPDHPVNSKPHKPISTIRLEIPSPLQNTSNTNAADNFNVMVIQNEDDDPLLSHCNSLATPPTTPVHHNKFTPRKSPRLTQTASSFNPTDALYACGSNRPCTAFSSRVSDNVRYPYGNPYTARVPRIVTTNPLYRANDEQSSNNKQCLNTDNFLCVYRYESRNKTPSSYTTSSSKQPSPSIRIPYSPMYSEDTSSNQSSGLGYYQRMDKRLLGMKSPRTPPPTANTTTIPIVKSNTSVGMLTIPELQTS